MAQTYEPIASVTLTNKAGDITFSSIPATYTDLRIILNARNDYGSSSSSGSFLRINYVNTTTYWYVYNMGAGSGTVTNSWQGSATASIYYGEIMQNSNPVNSFSTNIIDFYSYSSSSVVKNMAVFGADKILNSPGYVTNFYGNNKDTAIITSITLYTGSVGSGQNFISGTNATLYGIKAA